MRKRSRDLDLICRGWDYSPYDVTVRVIKGLNGKKKIQMRLDLGVLQIEINGRPDGKRPHGKESWLEHYQGLLDAHLNKFSQDKDFFLTDEDCGKLLLEAIQYYYRYISLYKLGKYDLVIRDTERNLKVYDLVSKYAENDEDVWSFEQSLPYLIMMNTKAKGKIELKNKNYNAAVEIVRVGIKRLKKLYYADEKMDDDEMTDVSAQQEQEEDAAQEDSDGPYSLELESLESWLNSIQQRKPITQKEKLEREMKIAIAHQNYERAALLRDHLSKIKNKTKT